MTKKRLIPVLLAAALLPACQTSNIGTKETVGALGGAGLGGYLGSQIGSGTGQLAATAAGVVIGGLLGSQLGKSLDRADQAYAQQAYSQAYQAPVGQPITWNNPQSGNYGSVTTLRDGYAQGGTYCREFQQTINVGGRTERATGTACQQPDGSWKIVQ